MPEGTRNTLYIVGILAAILISVGLGWTIYSDASHSDALYQRVAQQRASDYSERANIAAESRCADLPAPAQAQCIAEEREAARPSERYEYDLEAQRAMAVWNRAMGIAAIVAMSVGIVGVGLVFVTFYETRRAATASADSAKHAARAAEAAVHQHRAWLKVASLKVSEVEFIKATNRPDAPEFISANVVVEVSNVGATPATNVRCDALVWAAEMTVAAYHQWRKLWDQAIKEMLDRAERAEGYGFVLFPGDKPIRREMGVNTLVWPVEGSLPVDSKNTNAIRLFGLAAVFYQIAGGDRAMTTVPFFIHVGEGGMSFAKLAKDPHHEGLAVRVTRMPGGDRAT